MAEKLHNDELSFYSAIEASKYFAQHRTKNQTELTEKEGTCFICYDEAGRTLSCTHYLCADCILYYSWEQVVQGGHNISCPLCKLQIPTQEMMKLGEVTKTEGEWIEKFLLMNLKESLNAPHDLSHCLNQVLQASPLKEIFDLNNNRLEIPELRACPSCQTMVEHTVGCYKMTCVGCSSSFCFICLKVRTAETACPTTMEMFRCETACKQTL